MTTTQCSLGRTSEPIPTRGARRNCAKRSGTLKGSPIDRVARDKPFYSGKHKRHGMNLRVIASPDGDVLWVSGALPGTAHRDRPTQLRALQRQGDGFDPAEAPVACRMPGQGVDRGGRAAPLLSSRRAW